MPARLDQLTIGAPDPSDLLAFYDAVAAPLGLVRLDVLVDEEEDDADVEASGWGPDGGAAFIWIVTSPAATTGVHVRLQVASRDDVDRFYSAATRHGGLSSAAPRRWTLYRRGEYGASVLDPLGNLIEVVAPE